MSTEKSNENDKIDDNSHHSPLAKRSTSVKNLIKLFQPKLEESSNNNTFKRASSPVRNLSLSERGRQTSIHRSNAPLKKGLYSPKSSSYLASKKFPDHSAPKKSFPKGGPKKFISAKKVGFVPKNDNKMRPSVSFALAKNEGKQENNDEVKSESKDNNNEDIKVTIIKSEVEEVPKPSDKEVGKEVEIEKSNDETMSNKNEERTEEVGKKVEIEKSNDETMSNKSEERAEKVEDNKQYDLTTSSEQNKDELSNSKDKQIENSESDSRKEEKDIDQTSSTETKKKKSRNKHSSQSRRRNHPKTRNEENSPNSKVHSSSDTRKARSKKTSKKDDNEEKKERPKRKRKNEDRRVERVNTAPELRERKVLGATKKEDFARISKTGLASPRGTIYLASSESISDDSNSGQIDSFYDSEKSFEDSTESKEDSQQKSEEKMDIVINTQAPTPTPTPPSTTSTSKKKKKPRRIIKKINVNIWDEPPSSEKNLVMEEDTMLSYRMRSEMARKGGQGLSIKYASINKLIEHLTWPDYNEEDKIFAKILLNTYEGFTTPEVILQKLRERMQVPKNDNMSEKDWEVNIKAPIQSRVCSVLKLWIDNFSSNLKSKMIKQFKAFIKEELKDENHVPLINILNTSLEQRRKKDSILKVKTTHSRKASLSVSRNVLNKSKSESSIRINDKQKIIHQIELISVTDAARCITLTDSKVFRMIKPWEIMRQVWDDDTYTIHDSPLKNLVERFNKISSFVVSTILSQNSPKNRAKLLTRFIKIAKQLKRLNNFNSLMAILSGINHSCIQRLNLTLNQVSKKNLRTLRKLDRFMSVKNNFGRYRECIIDIDEPCVPYLGLVIADFSFIEESNDDSQLNEGLINFSKMKQIYFNCIEVVQRCQIKPYTFESTRGKIIDKLIENHKHMDQNEIYQRSILLEPVQSTIN